MEDASKNLCMQFLEVNRNFYRSMLKRNNRCDFTGCLWDTIGNDNQMIRIGTGYDVHQLVKGRPLIIGGVTIPHELGLLGHSDADVLTHAITDAILGALALGSIGDWFPDTDPKYKNADSIELLKHVMTEIKQRGFRINNLDSVIIAQEPKFKPHITAIRECLAESLECGIDLIGVKATTTEKLGFEGRKEGIAAQASVILQSI